jgi:hypothetical protein
MRMGRGLTTRNRSQGGVIASRLTASAKKPNTASGSPGRICFTRKGLQERSKGRRTIEAMGHGPASPARLTQGEQRALASFYAGRLPAGQLHAALSQARASALAAAAAHEAPAEVALPVPEAPVPAVPAPALRAA